VHNRLYLVFKNTHISFEQVLNLCQKLLLNSPQATRMQPTLNGNRQMAPVCTTHNTCFLATGRVQIQTATRSVQPFLHRLLQKVTVFKIRADPILWGPLKLTVPYVIQTPNSKERQICRRRQLTYRRNSGSLGPPESSTLTTSRSVKPFL